MMMIIYLSINEMRVTRLLQSAVYRLYGQKYGGHCLVLGFW